MNMKATKIPDAILTSDWHLRESQPICRTDNFWDAQWAKVDFVSELQTRYNCPVLHAGDLFHHWRPSPFLLTTAMEHLPKKFYSVYGQHDLPQHSLELARKCGMYALATSGHVKILTGAHFGQVPGGYEQIGFRTVVVWHRLVWHTKRPWPGCPDPNAEAILEQYNICDLILTGDNHKPFIVESDGRLLVNPGSLTRQNADEDHRPRVYLWYSKDNIVEPVYIPIVDGVVSREHIDHIQERDERIEAFISLLNDNWDVGVDFLVNLEHFEKENNVRRSVIVIIRKAIEK